MYSCVLFKEQEWIIQATPGVILVPLRVGQADNIVPPSPVVTPRVIVVSIVVVIVDSSVIGSIDVGSTLVWINATSALRVKLFMK